ncbi:MAG: hypothetical protein GY865_01250 [candidate division Zixibacteria bacterium]|nr:hypothetical protein [candidate division Zixibacteria bacterium]
MKMFTTRYQVIALMTMMVLGLSISVFAGDIGETISINGFGHQSYLKTDTNTYVVEDANDGSFRDYVTGLTFSARPSEKVFIRAQMLHSSAGLQVDWGFGEYHFNDNFGFKAGKVKLPFGFYSETMDVKALQPFSYLTGIYFYGVNSYNGVGFFGSHEFNSGWGADLEVFAGASITADGTGILKDFYGGQFWLRPPVDGLKLGFGHWETEINVPGWPVFPVAISMFSGEYIADSWFLRSEYNLNIQTHEKTGTNLYIEGGFMINDYIQPVVRWANTKLEEGSLALSYGIEDTENAYSFGVNVFPSPGMVVKLEHHIMKGDASLQATQREGLNLGTMTLSGPSGPENNWSLTSMSVAFMF